MTDKGKSLSEEHRGSASWPMTSLPGTLSGQAASWRHSGKRDGIIAEHGLNSLLKTDLPTQNWRQTSQ